MNLDDIVAYIQRPTVEWQDNRDTVKLPWDITPDKYIKFAQDEIVAKDERSVINALSNAKRALACQVDSLLLAFGLDAACEKWSFPRKLERLEMIGIIAPSVLKKINKERNEMEHGYALPDREAIVDFVGIVALFIAATNRHIFNRRCYMEYSELGDTYLPLIIKLTHEGLHVSTAGPGWTDQQELDVPITSLEEYSRLLGAINRSLGPW